MNVFTMCAGTPTQVCGLLVKSDGDLRDWTMIGKFYYCRECFRKMLADGYLKLDPKST